MAGKSPAIIPTATPDETDADRGSPPTIFDDVSSVPPGTTYAQTICKATPMNAGDAPSPEAIQQPDQYKKTTLNRPQRASVGDYMNDDDLSPSVPPRTDGRVKFYIGEKQEQGLEKTYEDANAEGEDEDASSFLEGMEEDQAISKLIRFVIDKVKADLMNERANTLGALELSTTEPILPEAISYAENGLSSEESTKTIGQKEVEKSDKTPETENLYERDEDMRLLEKEEDEIGALINSVLVRAESDVLSERNEVPHSDSEELGDDARFTSVERNLPDDVNTSSIEDNRQAEVIFEDLTAGGTLSGGDSGSGLKVHADVKSSLSHEMQNDRQIEDVQKISQGRAGDKVTTGAKLERHEVSTQNTDELETQRTGAKKHEKSVHDGALNFLDNGEGKDEVTVDDDDEEEEELKLMIGFIIDSARSSLVKPVDISTASSEDARNDSNDEEIVSVPAEENETFSAQNEDSQDALKTIQNGFSVEGHHDNANEKREATGDATLKHSGGENLEEEQDEVVAILQPLVDDVSTEFKSSLSVNNIEPQETGTDDKVSSVAKEIMDKIISILSSRTLSDDANVPPAPVKVNDSTDRSERASLPCKPTADSLQQNPTSPHHNTTSSVIGQQVPLSADDIVSDSDSDNDTGSDSETKSNGVDENHWECLAIRQISKSQSTLVHYGDTYHSWYPTYNTSHLGDTDLLKKYKEATCDRVERKLDKMATKRNETDTMSSKPDKKIPQNGKEVNKDLPNRTGNISKKSQHEVKSAPATLHPEPEAVPNREAVESGMALINDRLRKKIVTLEQQMKKLALNLTFLGDRNWRLEAYIDCLIKTLEVLEVTDVVDLDQKTLPLCLFRVKVKAGYKLSSFNGIPSRSLWSYAKDGRKPPFVDLSGWGDTEKPAKNTVDPSFTPTPADDVGLSATQMYQYESQIEELSIQNQILEAQLREANWRAEASVTAADTADIGLQSLQQAQQTDQPQYIQHDALQRHFLQQQLQQLQEYHHEQWSEINQQLEQQQQLQQQQMEQQQVLNTTVGPSSQPQEQEQQFAISSIPQQPPELQQQQQLPNHHQQQQPQGQSYQFQQNQPPLLQQQQQQHQLLYQPALQQTWLPKAVQDEVVTSATTDWIPSGQLGLQDPQDWPTLTESQATVDARSFSNSEKVTEGSSHSVPTRRPKPLAGGTVSDITQPKVTSSPNHKSTLYSSLSLPASTGSIPNNEDRHDVPHDNQPKARAHSSSSAQSINRGRRFETNYRREPPRGSPSPHQSRSGTEPVSRAPRHESFRRFDSWNSSCPSYSDYRNAVNRRHHHNNWYPERPVYRNNWPGPSHAHQLNGQLDPNYDCTQRLLRAAESGLESVFGTDHVMFFKNQMQRERSRDFENNWHSNGPQRTHEYNGSSSSSGNHGCPSHGRLYGRRPTTPTRRGAGAWNRGPHRTFRPTETTRGAATDEPRNE